MRIADHMDIKGRLTLHVRNAAGVVVEVIRAPNSIVLSGRDLVAKQFINEPINPISHVAVGTGTAAIDPNADTALDSELFRKPLDPIDTSLHLTTTGDGKKKVVITAELDFNEGNGALTEAGLFNDGTGGVMYNRVVFLPINKTTDFKLTLLWEIVF